MAQRKQAHAATLLFGSAAQSSWHAVSFIGLLLHMMCCFALYYLVTFVECSLSHMRELLISGAVLPLYAGTG